MRQAGYETVMTSTQSRECAQHFYERLGYEAVGGFLPPGEGYELMFVKTCEGRAGFMIIWLNGAFGAGKTQTAYELGRRISGAYVSAGRGGALGCVSRAERDAAAAICVFSDVYWGHKR